MACIGRNSPTAPRRVLATERRVRAVELRRAGVTFAAIGRELGVTDQGARKMVNTALADLAREAHEHTEALRALESERLAEVAMALRPLALQGDVAAAREYRAYSESFRKLWGLDVKPDIEGGPQVVVIETRAPWDRPGHPDYAPAPDTEFIDGTATEVPPALVSRIPENDEASPS